MNPFLAILFCLAACFAIAVIIYFAIRAGMKDERPALWYKDEICPLCKRRFVTDGRRQWCPHCLWPDQKEPI